MGINGFVNLIQKQKASVHNSTATTTLSDTGVIPNTPQQFNLTFECKENFVMVVDLVFSVFDSGSSYVEIVHVTFLKVLLLYHYFEQTKDCIMSNCDPECIQGVCNQVMLLCSVLLQTYFRAPVSVLTIGTVQTVLFC